MTTTPARNEHVIAAAGYIYTEAEHIYIEAESASMPWPTSKLIMQL